MVVQWTTLPYLQVSVGHLLEVLGIFPFGLASKISTSLRFDRAQEALRTDPNRGSAMHGHQRAGSGGAALPTSGAKPTDGSIGPDTTHGTAI